MKREEDLLSSVLSKVVDTSRLRIKFDQHVLSMGCRNNSRQRMSGRAKKVDVIIITSSFVHT